MEMEGLSVICADLGIAEEDDNGRRIGYQKSEYCLDNLKDLLRFLRRDDPQTREVFKQVCKWNIVSKDMIPIIEYHQDERNLMLNAVKVLVFLTMPIDPSSNDIPQQIEYLWGLKSSITLSNVVTLIVSLLEGPLENLELEAFAEEDWKLVQLVFTLFRNLLAIQDIASLQKAGESANQFLSLRDKFLELLFHENVMDIFVVITQNIGGSSSFLRQDNLLLLEIFHYIFLGQNPELVAKAHINGSKVDGHSKASIESLKSVMEEEEMKRKLARLHTPRVRHSQFSGTYTRVTMDGSKAVLKGNPSASENSLKPHKVRGAAEKIVWEQGPIPSVKDETLQLLHDFVNQFLSGGYNVLMQSVSEDIEKEHHSIENRDISIFFQVARFVTSFVYHKSAASKPNVGTESFEAANDHGSILKGGGICGPIAATMNESMFSLVMSKWRLAFEGLKETKDFRFLSPAGSLMKTMICMLELVIKLVPDDCREAQTTRILLYKLFYDQTDQGMCQFLLNLVKAFDSHNQPKSDLADLVETIHVIVGLMENLQERGTLRVSKKSRKARKKKASSNQKGIENELPKGSPGITKETDVIDGEQTADISNLEKEESVNVTSSEVETSTSAIKNSEGEMAQMHDINCHVDDDPCSGDDSSGDEQAKATDEVDFKVSTFVSAFASCSIIKNLCWLLKFYKSNSNQTNHHIVCMLRRITDELELSAMLYQLSLLSIFYKILDEQKACPCKDYENIVDFLKVLVRGMLKKMKTQPLLFVEILFWKTRRECHYINAEYLLHELGHARKEFGNQENNAANGGDDILQDKGWTHRSIADALGDDEADVVISHDLGFQNEDGSLEREPEKASQRKERLILDDAMVIKIRDLYDKYKEDKNCSRLIAESLDPDGRISAAQVANKLKQLGLATRKRLRHGDDSNQVEAKSLMQPSNTRKRVSVFSQEQEALIKELYEKFKDQKRCCYLIANALGSENTFTTAQVSRKLKQLGLRLPRQKKAEADMKLRDNETSNFLADGSDDSDNETLSALRNRKFGRNSKNGKLRKTREARSDEDKEERDRTSPWDNSDAMETDTEQDRTPKHASPEADHTDVEMDQNVLSPQNQSEDLSDDKLEDDELADSGDDMAAEASLTQSPLSRRKMKMVIDMEDDDD